MKKGYWPLLRALTLFMVLANVAYNYLVERFAFSGQSVQVVSDRYHNAFSPAPYAFAIWGVIYTAFIAYGIAQLLPANRERRGLDAMSGMLLVINGLAIAWVALFRQDQIALSLGIIVAMLTAGVALYVCAQEQVDRRESRWWRLPASLFLGWISVATIANVAAFFVAHGIHGGHVGESPWAITMMLLATIFGVSIALRYNDFIVPMVIGWATVAIGVESGRATGGIALAAYTLASISALVAFIVIGLEVARRYPSVVPARAATTARTRSA